MTITSIETEEFKTTELGRLPSDWEIVRLSQVLEEVDTRVCDSNITESSQCPVLSLTKEYGLIPQTERFGKRIATKDVSNYKVVEQGQVVYNPYVIWEGAVHILRYYVHGLVSPVYPVWQVRATIADAYFVDQWLRMPHAISAYNRFAAGAVNRRRSIRKTDFLSIEIPLPPLPEQKKIAYILSTVQTAIEKEEVVIAASRELKKSLIKYLFTYGPVAIDEVESVPLKETEIGSVPEGWGVVRLGDFAEVKYGKANPNDGGLIPVVGSGGVFSYTATPLVEHPTIVVGRKGSAGRAWLFQSPCYPADTTFYLRWKKKVDVAYLYSYMILHPLSGIHAKTTLPSLQKPDLENMLVPCPSLATQELIADLAMRLATKVEAEESNKQALQVLFQTLLKNLMTGKIRVNNLEVPV